MDTAILIPRRSVAYASIEGCLKEDSPASL